MSFGETRPSQPAGAPQGRPSPFSLILWGFAAIVVCCAIVASIGILTTRGNPIDLFPDAAAPTASPALVFPSPGPTNTLPSDPILLPPAGQIVFACQVYYTEQKDQICLINTDGTGLRQLTVDPQAEYFYPSFAPDGRSVVFASNRTGHFEIYEMDLQGTLRQLTEGLGDLFAPEISPDGTQIVFTRNNSRQASAVWVMNRDGSGARAVFGPEPAEGWDPTWSPDGSQILFASRINKVVQLFIINLDGTGLRRVTNMEGLRGRTDWSPEGKIVTYAGTSWGRELYMMNTDGSQLGQITPAGGNSQGPSFSPDGKWVTFTAYFDHIGDVNACEIYVMRIDTAAVMRLTANDYCDWQPRWGP